MLLGLQVGLTSFAYSVLKTSALVTTQEELLELLENYGFQAARIEVLMDSGRLAEVAELRVKEGNIIEGIQLFLRTDSTTSHQRAASCILNGLWRLYPLGALPQFSSDVETLLDLSKQLNTRHIDSRLKSEVAQDVSRILPRI